jgi:hypothetical protein
MKIRPAPSAPLRFRSLEIGKSLTAEKTIAAPTLVFGPRDTVYLSVATEGVSQGNRGGARFIYQTGQRVFESTQPVMAIGPTRTEFHIWRDAGWPLGRYRVDVFIDSVPAGGQEYVVEKD